MVALGVILLVCVALIVNSQEGTAGQTGGPPEDSPDHPSRPPPSTVYNPVNNITINIGCNRTEEDNQIRQELKDIKDLLNTIINGLEDGDYCPGSPSSSTMIINPRDCYEVQENGDTSSGVYTIQPDGSDPFQVYCDLDTDGGGWTVFQRRENGSVDFYREWIDYENGFGSLKGEHWLGNEKLHYLTNQTTYGLRVDLADFDDITRYAKYDSFVVADADDKYRLQIGSYSGDAGDAMAMCDNEQFSTHDQDNDAWDSNCAVSFKGGWWYESCHEANPNGAYLAGEHTTYADGVEWLQWRGYYYSLKFTELKLRPV